MPGGNATRRTVGSSCAVPRHLALDGCCTQYTDAGWLQGSVSIVIQLESAAEETPTNPKSSTLFDVQLLHRVEPEPSGRVPVNTGTLTVLPASSMLIGFIRLSLNSSALLRAMCWPSRRMKEPSSRRSLALTSSKLSSAR
jgi:hypothetical protein